MGFVGAPVYWEVKKSSPSSRSVEIDIAASSLGPDLGTHSTRLRKNLAAAPHWGSPKTHIKETSDEVIIVAYQPLLGIALYDPPAGTNVSTGGPATTLTVRLKRNLGDRSVIYGVFAPLHPQVVGPSRLPRDAEVVPEDVHDYVDQ